MPVCGLTQTRLVSLWEHGPLSNVTMTFGVMAALGIMCFIVFVPGIDMVGEEKRERGQATASS